MISAFVASLMDSSVHAMARLLEAERLRTQLRPFRREVAVRPLIAAITRSAARAVPDLKPADQARVRERLKIDCPDDLRVHTDPDLLSAILGNLVGNAIKHAPDGDIWCSAHPREDGGCRLTVRDQGAGIPADQVPRVFEKFEQKEGTAPGGFGLGLFIARRAAELLGARLHVVSEVDRGTSFHVDLPPRERGSLL